MASGVLNSARQMGGPIYTEKGVNDPWNRYGEANPPPFTTPWDMPSWYYRGEQKVAEYKGYQSQGLEPNNRWWSDNGQGYRGYQQFFALPQQRARKVRRRKKKARYWRY